MKRRAPLGNGEKARTLTPSERAEHRRDVFRRVLLAVLGLGVLLGATPVHLQRVSRAQLCVTKGAIQELPGQRLSVTVPTMRAVVTEATPQVVEARFTYLGPTLDTTRLGSGQLRRQIGLKLHAQDSCNVVYAMWRIEPEVKLIISVKHNPGMHVHAECGTRGYSNVMPRRAVPVPPLKPGDAHSLRAEMKDREMQVHVDGTLVWEGAGGLEALAFDGPVGLRTDNVHVELELLAGAAVPGQASPVPSCREDTGDTD